MAKIMLVEDDNNLREIYGARLQAEGHQIVSAKDGEEALAMAVREKPELIISDVMMPKISGFDMLDILRNAPETKYTKVIMMTALSQAEDQARATKLGADKYLVKSQVTLEDVAHAVKEVLGSDSGSPASTVPATDVPAVATDPQQTATTTSVEDPTAAIPAPDAASSTTDPTTVQSTSIPVSTAPSSESEDVTSVPTTSTPAPGAPEAAAAPVSAEPVATPPATETEKIATKIEIVEAPPAEETPVAPTQQPESPAAPDTSNATTTPEVVLPTPPTEQPAPATTSNQGEATQDQPSAETTVQPAVGPNLQEALTQETEATNPEPATTEQTDSYVSDDPESPLDDNGSHKKVIQPINDPLKKPDLNALLAAEEAKETATPQENAGPTQQTAATPTPEVQPAQPQANAAPTNPGNPDPNNIAL